MSKFKLPIKIFSLWVFLASSNILSASFEAPDEETNRFFLSLSYPPSHRMVSSPRPPALARQNSFDVFTSWVLDEPQATPQASSFSSAPLLPLGRTTSFEKVLEELEHSTEDSNTTASSHTSLNISHMMDTMLADPISNHSEEEVDHTSLPPKKEKRSPEEQLKTTREHNKIAARFQRKRNRLKLSQLDSLAEQDPSLKAQIDEIESRVSGACEVDRAFTKRLLPKGISPDEKKRKLNKVGSSYLRQKQREKMQLLESYLEKKPNLTQEGAAAAD